MEKRKRCEKPTGGYRCNACLQSFKEIELFKTHCQQAHNIVTMMNKSLMGAGLKRYEKQSQKVTPPHKKVGNNSSPIIKKEKKDIVVVQLDDSLDLPETKNNEGLTQESLLLAEAKDTPEIYSAKGLDLDTDENPSLNDESATSICKSSISDSFGSKSLVSSGEPNDKDDTKDSESDSNVLTKCLRSSSSYQAKAKVVKPAKKKSEILCPVPNCGKTFSPKELHRYTNHIEIHEGLKSFVCPHCEIGYSSDIQLLEHVSITHTKDSPFTCQLCEKSYKVKRFFDAHVEKCRV